MGSQAKEGLVFGSLAVLARTGLGLAGGMWGYLAARLVLAPKVILTKQITAVKQSPKTAIRWFALS